MTGGAFLIGVGVMLALAGGVALTAGALGVGTPAPERAAGRLGRLSRARPRPVHALAAVSGLVTLLLTGWVAAGLGAAGAVLIVPGVLAGGGGDLELARLEALGAWTRRLGDLLSSGAASSLDRALQRSAAVAPQPIAAHVSTLVARMGPQGARAALLGFAHDLADPVADEVVMALILQLRHGGRGLAAVLDDVAGHVEEQIRMRREVEADRAKPRSNVRTIILLTLGLSAGLALLARSYLAPYSTPAGQLALAAVTAVFGAALLWLRAMTRPEPGVRLLAEADFTQPGQR